MKRKGCSPAALGFVAMAALTTGFARSAHAEDPECPPEADACLIDGRMLKVPKAQDDAQKALAWRRFIQLRAQRLEREREFQSSQSSVPQPKGARLRQALAELRSTTERLVEMTMLLDTQPEQPRVKDILQELDAQLDEAREQLPDTNATATALRAKLRQVHPDVPHRSSDPGHVAALDFVTPRGQPGWRALVEANRYYRAAQQRIDSGTSLKPQRDALLTMADLALASADRAYANGDIPSGDTMTKAALSVIDTAWYPVDATGRLALNGRPGSFLAGVLNGAVGFSAQPALTYERWFGAGRTLGEAEAQQPHAAAAVQTIQEMLEQGHVAGTKRGANDGS